MTVFVILLTSLISLCFTACLQVLVLDGDMLVQSALHARLATDSKR